MAISVEHCKRDVALILLKVFLKRHLAIAAKDLSTHGTVLLRWAIEGADVALVRFIIGAGVEPSMCLVGHNTFLHLAVIKVQFDVMLALLEYNVDINLRNDANCRPLELLSTENKKRIFLSMEFPLSMLCAGDNQLWFYIRAVFEYTQKNPQSARVVDRVGRIAEDVATSVNKAAIRRAYLPVVRPIPHHGFAARTHIQHVLRVSRMGRDGSE